MKNRIILPSLLSILLAVMAAGVSAQSRLVQSELNEKFSRVDVVRLATPVSSEQPFASRELKLTSGTRLALTPSDIRSPRYHADDTGPMGMSPAPEAAIQMYSARLVTEPGSSGRINVIGAHIEGYFTKGGDVYFVEPASNYSTHADAADLVVYRMQDIRDPEVLGCDTGMAASLERGKSMIGQGRVETVAGMKRLEIATDADMEYVTTLGGSAAANAEILGILNTVQGLYSEELNVQISVVYQHTWSTGDPYTGSSPETLTRSFQAYWNNNFTESSFPRDTAHLFSGKTSVLSQGWAFIGAVCRDPGSSYGTSGYISWAPGKYLVPAHEVAHNLGANHVDTPQNCGNTLMNAQLTGTTPMHLCTYSQNEIGGYLSANGSCVTSGVASACDYDGDTKTDISIFRPAAGEWWYLKSSDGGNRAFQFGQPTDRIVPADYTGDGKADIAFFRPSTGEWYILRSNDLSFYSFPFGTAGDVPVAADFDGDGAADAAVFRPSSGTWFILNSSGGVTITTFGVGGDRPVPADYDGDGKADIAIFRPAVGEWWYLRSSDGGNRAFQFGNSADRPVQADYTGDGRADVGIFRPSTGEWFVLRSEDGSYYSFPFGTNGDIPSPGDYDGDGKTDATVYRPSSSLWFSNTGTAGVIITTFGSSGDIPSPSAFVP